MGQYYQVVNLDKKEFLHPHKFNDGLKLMEFGQSAGGTLTGLAILLADGNGRGGGDICSESPIIGSWAGDRIVVTGDYADPGKFIPGDVTQEQLQAIANEHYSEGYQQAERVNLYSFIQTHFRDVSDDVMAVLRDAGEDRASYSDAP